MKIQYFILILVLINLLITVEVKAQNSVDKLSTDSIAQFQIVKKNDTLFIKSRTDEPLCNKMSPLGYPKQYPDDYLHEERFTGLPNVVLFDHIATRKMINVFVPTLNDPNANLCGVNLIIENPKSGEVAVFYDIFNWMNRDGVQIFNINKEINQIWGFSGTKQAFPIQLKQEKTGYDFSFNHKEIKLNFYGL